MSAGWGAEAVFWVAQSSDVQGLAQRFGAAHPDLSPGHPPHGSPQATFHERHQPMWTEFKQLFRLSFRLYFAPLVGAWRGAIQESERVQRELMEWSRRTP